MKELRLPLDFSSILLGLSTCIYYKLLLVKHQKKTSYQKWIANFYLGSIRK